MNKEGKILSSISTAITVIFFIVVVLFVSLSVMFERYTEEGATVMYTEMNTEIIESEVSQSYTTVETTEETTQRYSCTSEYRFTEEELMLLARCIHAEGGDETFITQVLIGSVVMNRVDSPKFPDTIREVIYQKNQFSVTTKTIDGVVMIDREPSEDSIKAALLVLEEGSFLPPDVQVFYADGKTKDPWVLSRKQYLKSDKTMFSYIYSEEETSND